MKTLLTVCALLVATTVFAESLEEKKFWKRQRDYIDETLKRTNKACETNLTFDWDNQIQLRTEVEKTKHSHRSRRAPGSRASSRTSCRISSATGSFARSTRRRATRPAPRSSSGSPGTRCSIGSTATASLARASDGSYASRA
jgi:hypothetical protein